MAAGSRDRAVPPPLPDDDDAADGACGCDHIGQRERNQPQPLGPPRGRTLQDQPIDSDLLR